MRKNLLLRQKNAKVSFLIVGGKLDFSDITEEAEGYTSLYGDSDNQYEEIQAETKFDGLKSIKELLLRVTFKTYTKQHT